jgi:cytochrome c oxidase assembly factor CtaG
MRAPSLPSLLVSHWTMSASVLAPAVGFGLLYVIGARRTRARWPAHRTVSFLAGIACVVTALLSGVDAYDDQMLSVHMVQHMLLLLVAPPLLLGGRPVILALRALAAGRRSAVASALARTRKFTAPAPALALFAGVVILTHLPSFYDATLRYAALHYTEHALYVGAGLQMWSVLMDGDPAPAHRLSGLGRLGYLIVAMMPMALVGAYLNRHASLFYPPYGPAARALGISALDDQGQAGAIMWVVGSVLMVALGLWSAVAAMVAEERRQVARDAREGSVVAGGGSVPAGGRSVVAGGGGPPA